MESDIVVGAGFFIKAPASNLLHSPDIEYYRIRVAGR